MEPPPLLDVAAARRQHRDYVAALEGLGLEVIHVDADEAHPDCPFVEDVAVVVGDVAVLTIPGAPSRRGEVAPVAAALSDLVGTVALEPPATLDGGDVLTLGRTVYVGRSARTNDEGIRQFGEIAGRHGRRVVPVPVTGALHLKTVVDRLDDETVLVAPGHVAAAALAGLRVVETAPGERAAANVLAIGGRVLVPTRFEETAARVAAAGFAPMPVDTSEFAKADGGLTCLSIRL